MEWDGQLSVRLQDARWRPGQVLGIQHLLTLGVVGGIEAAQQPLQTAMRADVDSGHLTTEAAVDALHPSICLRRARTGMAVLDAQPSANLSESWREATAVAGLRCGFDQPNQFATMFRQMTAMSPRAYCQARKPLSHDQGTPCRRHCTGGLATEQLTAGLRYVADCRSALLIVLDETARRQSPPFHLRNITALTPWRCDGVAATSDLDGVTGSGTAWKPAERAAEFPAATGTVRWTGQGTRQPKGTMGGPRCPSFLWRWEKANGPVDAEPPVADCAASPKAR